MKKESILIVDDEAMVREMIRDMLEAEGYQATAVESGKSALRVAQEVGFDLVLADIKMPEMDGFQLVQELRHQVPDIIPILITAYASVTTARQAIQHGVFDYIVKPFDRAELLTIMQGALSRKRLAKENARLKSLVGLLQVGQTVAASSEYPHMLEFIVRTAVEQTRSLGGSIMLFDPATGEVTTAAMLGSRMYAAHIADVMLKTGASSLRAQIGSGILFTDREQHPLFELLQHRGLDEQLRASGLAGGEILLLPIETDREATDMLTICRGAEEKPLSQEDLELLRILAAEASVAVKGHRALSQMESDCLVCLRSVASVVDGRSPYTRSHMERVARLSRQFGRKIGLSETEANLVSLAASLHDLGKIGISEAILSRPEGGLTLEERNHLRRHPVIADEILAPLPFLSEARAIIRHHHEQFDGNGYPDGLLGKEITLATQVLIVANAYNNLTSGCAGNPALPSHEALLKLQEGKGTRFHPEITDSFVNMMRAGEVRR